MTDGDTATVEATDEQRRPNLPGWLLVLVPVAALAALIAVLLAVDPVSGLRDAPPVESLAVERTVLSEGEIELHVRNDGSDPVTVAQVLVNDAYWTHELNDRTIDRLEGARLQIPYPWEEGLPLHIALITSTGVTIEHDIEVALETPDTGGRSLVSYGLLGVYIGLIPVALGLLWLAPLRFVSRQWRAALLAFTVGLLAFLLVDTVEEGIEIADAVPAPLGGLQLFVIGALAVLVAITVVERRAAAAGERMSPLAVAYLVAFGIGLHNLGEGLAVAAAVAVGALSLGSSLVLGFALHNTTEGLAIAALLSRERRPAAGHFVALVAVAGVPTIFGAWAGALAFSPTWAALAFGVAAGAIVQVIVAVGRDVLPTARAAWSPAGAGFVAGLAFMYVTALFAG